MEIDEDDEYAPSPEEIAAEEEEEPLMMQNAEAWDDFLDYVNLLQMDWAAPEEDTDLYRKRRAVEFFNAGEPACARRLQIWSDSVCACAATKWQTYHLIRMMEAAGVVGATRDVLHSAQTGPHPGRPLKALLRRL